MRPWGLQADDIRLRLPKPVEKVRQTASDVVDPNHDADIRIDSEAPKQRCPFLIVHGRDAGRKLRNVNE